MCSPVGEYAAGQAARVTEGRNNAQLFDRNEENQKLTAAEIESMKKEGKVWCKLQVMLQYAAGFPAEWEG